MPGDNSDNADIDYDNESLYIPIVLRNQGATNSVTRRPQVVVNQQQIEKQQEANATFEANTEIQHEKGICGKSQ